MKKIGLFIALFALILSLASCSGNSSNINFNSFKENMIKADADLPEMKEVSSDSEDAQNLFKSISDMDYSKVADYFLFYSSDGSPYEIAAVQVKSGDDVSECEDSLKNHVDSRIQLYSNYAPENVEKAEKALVITRENIIALIMCDNQEQVKEAFENSFK